MLNLSVQGLSYSRPWMDVLSFSYKPRSQVSESDLKEKDFASAVKNSISDFGILDTEIRNVD